MAGAQDESNLFNHLQDDLTSDQWDKLKELKDQLKETGMLEESDDDDDEDLSQLAGLSIENSPEHEIMIEYDIDSQDEADEEEEQSGFNTTDISDLDLENINIAGPSISASSVDLGVPGVDKETTMKYLSGVITFEEFNAILEKNKEEQEKNENREDEERLTTNEEEPSTSNREDGGDMQKKRRKRGKMKSRLPKDLQGLMGEANLKFARGEHDETIKMCMECIRLVPTAWEPFQTLAMLYEDRGDIEKSLQFSLIAAHLSPPESEEWVRLAELSIEQGHTSQAITCYNQAIRCDKKNLPLHYERCGLYQKLGEDRRVLECFHEILNILSTTSDTEGYFKMARDLTKIHHDDGDVNKAIEIMSKALKLQPEVATSEDINLLVELYVSVMKYEQALEILLKHCGISLSNYGNIELSADAALAAIKVNDNQSEPSVPPSVTSLAKCHIPDGILIDLRVKLVVCLINLKQKNLVRDIVEGLCKESVEEVGDLYLDVAEAFMENGYYAQAKPLLATLVASTSFSQAAVWLKYGECLNSLGDIQSASRAFGEVVKLAPSHLGARVSLSALQQQLGLHDEALMTLQQEEPEIPEETGTISTQDMKLLFHRTLLLWSQRKYEEYIDISKQVLFSHFKETFDKKYLALILNKKSVRHRVEALRHVLGTEFEKVVKTAATLEGEHSITNDDLWDVYIKLCNLLIDMKRFKEFQDVSILALTCPQFILEETKVTTAEFICLIACILNKNGHFAYSFIKEMCVQDIDNNRAWNLFCQIITMSQDIRHNRFCLRLMVRHPENLPLVILNGHNAMVAGTYKHALGEYVAAFRQDPENPLLSLCIGITFIHLASQKYASKRHSLIIQGCSFLNQYRELRGECQESYYNLGRAMHQIGLLHAAVFYYQKALTFKCAVSGEEDIFDLRHEISYNLSLIYQASGSKDLAAMVLQQHCVV